MRNYTYIERVFLRSYYASRHGNKKRRKGKARGGVYYFSCGCCQINDNRRKILDRLHKEEMDEYR